MPPNEESNAGEAGEAANEHAGRIMHCVARDPTAAMPPGEVSKAGEVGEAT